MTETILKLIDQLDALGKTRDDACQITRAEGELLHQIALSTDAREIVEVGTSYGFSGLFWGAALLKTGGFLHTIDSNPEKVEAAKKRFAEAGLSAVITNHLGQAAEELAKLNGPFDLAFIDADRTSTRIYFDLIWPKLKPGGSIIVDNASTHREQLAEFVSYARGLADAISYEIAVGNGIEWTVKVEIEKA